MAAHNTKTDSKGRNCHQIFQELNKRQISALMFHDQMADYFDFLGLNGFKRMHEYQYFAESGEHRATKRYFINHHNKLLAEDDGKFDIDVIPDDWVRYSRMDVSSQIKKQAVEKGFQSYHDWESATKDCYQEYAEAFLELGAIADFNMIMELVRDVDTELKCLDRMLLDLKAVAFDEIYIVSIQHELHEYYRNKTDDLGFHIC